MFDLDDEEDKETTYAVTVRYKRFSIHKNIVINLAIECCCENYNEYEDKMVVYFSDKKNAQIYTSFLNNHIKPKSN